MGKPEKRKETEKTGSTPTNKDSRQDSPSHHSTSSTMSTSSAKTVVNNNGISYADVVADSNTRDSASVLDSNTSQRSKYDKQFQVPGKSSGLWRDQITVDVLLIDGQPMKDQLTQTEKLKIFYKMGLKAEIYNGISPGFAGHPVYTFS